MLFVLHFKNSIPIKNVNDRNINMEMSLVPTPNIEFNSGKIGAVNVNPIDLDYEKNDLKFDFKGPYVGLDIHF